MSELTQLLKIHNLPLQSETLHNHILHATHFCPSPRQREKPGAWSKSKFASLSGNIMPKRADQSCSTLPD
jgi:hypothetical protein